MIVGCYSLDLYCDAERAYPDGIHEFREFPHTFTAELGSVCRKRARKSGWKLDLKNFEAYCPKCNRPKHEA
jgi:hypothetical protein